MLLYNKELQFLWSSLILTQQYEKHLLLSFSKPSSKQKLNVFDEMSDLSLKSSNVISAYYVSLICLWEIFNAFIAKTTLKKRVLTLIWTNINIACLKSILLTKKKSAFLQCYHSLKVAIKALMLTFKVSKICIPKYTIWWINRNSSPPCPS